MKAIRLRLDKLLDQAGLNRSSFSKQAGISYPVVNRYYKNEVKEYDSKILLEICLALNCGISDLLEITDE